MTDQIRPEDFNPKVIELAQSLSKEELEQAVGMNFGQVLFGNRDDHRDTYRSFEGFLKAMLFGLIEEEEVETLPENFAKLRDSFDRVDYTPSSFDQHIWKSRVYERFVKSDDWQVWPEEAWTKSHKSVDTDRFVPALGSFEERYFLNEERQVLVKYELNYEGKISLEIYGEANDEEIDELINSVDHYVTLPDPYDGKIIRFDGTVKVMDIELGQISGYSEDVEEAVNWMSSVADEEIRKELKSHGLPARAGVLVQGPPGSGKTTLARRIATELVGNTTVVYPTPEADVEEIFEFADRYEPVLVVFEDVESFFGERGESDFSSFLNALDGLDQDGGMMVLATTNDASKFDEAVTRPGRLERSVTIAEVQPGAHFQMVKSRLPKETDGLIEKLLKLIEEKSSAAQKPVTPAVIDSLARYAIMLRLSGDELLKYAQEKWEPFYDGKSHI